MEKGFQRVALQLSKAPFSGGRFLNHSYKISSQKTKNDRVLRETEDYLQFTPDPTLLARLAAFIRVHLLHRRWNSSESD